MTTVKVTLVQRMECVKAPSSSARESGRASRTTVFKRHLQAYGFGKVYGTSSIDNWAVMDRLSRRAWFHAA